MIKRVIGLLLAISLLAGLPLSVLAATDGEWEYTIEDGKAIVMGYNGSETVLSIPLVLGGYPVTSIGVSAFSGCISLKSVTIPNSVTCIRSSAFYNCSGLTNVTIPNSVTEIRNHAFFGCSALTNVTIPNSVTSIGSSAFYDCSGLKNLTIPNSVTSIGNSAFSGCSGLTSATIPNGVTIIEDSVFYNCSGLSSVTIPTGVTRIGSNAFSGCTGLTNVTIPNSVTSIGYFTFRNCSSLTSITIPKGVTSIGERAFEGCQSLTTLMVAADNSKFKSVDDVLFTKAGTQLIVCAGGKQGAYAIPTGVANIGTWAFSGCISLTSVAIPTSVTSIGNGAFYNCSGLTDVYYAGSKAEWDQITIYSANDPVARATIHFDSIAGPSSDDGPAIPYIDEHGGAFSCDAYTIVTSSCTSWANGWYVVKDKLTISSRVGITGIVCLLLCDGAELIAEKGICVSSGNTLVIYGQSINSGVLKCNNIADNAGIGGNSYSTCGTITINGGTVISEYTSGAGSAGIGGGRRSGSGLITINGGNITASGAPGASAIGGGSFGDGNVIINGGVVNAKAKNEEYAGAGIGGGECAGFSVTITGGMINAEGSNTGTNYSSGASAIGGGTLPAAGTVTISGGSITATGANAINGGKNTVISILGGNIVANARVGTAYGDCIIQLDWTRRTDSIHVAEYSGNISMLKSFVLESNGEEATLNNINGVTIVPTYNNMDGLFFGDGHTYQLIYSEHGWNYMKRFCEEQSGHLACISSIEENTFLWDHIKSHAYVPVAFGFTDEGHENDWRWVSGEPVGFTNWNEGEPDNDTGNEHWAYFSDNGRWNDNINLTATCLYICEWDYIVEAENSVLFSHVENGKYCIHVLNESGNPLQDAEVHYADSSDITNSKGNALFDLFTVGTPTITVRKDGYMTWTNENSAWKKDESRYETVVLYPKEYGQYKLNLAYYSNSPISANGSSESPVTNVLAYTKKLSLSSDIAFDLDFGNFYFFCSANDATNVDHYQLWQNDKLIASSDTGVFSKLGVDSFTKGGGCFVRVVAKDGKRVDTNINLVFSENTLQKETGFSLMNDKIGITVSDDVPFLGGSSFSVGGLGLLPVDIKVTEDKVYLGLNAKIWPSDSSSGQTKGKFDEFKKSLEAVKNADAILGKRGGKGASAMMNSLMKMEPDFDLPGGSVKFNVIGYAEANWGSSTATGELYVVCKATTPTFGFTTWVVVVPVTVQISGYAEVKAGAKISYSFSDATLSGEFPLTLTLGLEAFVGVGVGQVMGGGFYGSADVKFGMQLFDDPFLKNIDLTGELGGKVYVGPFEYQRAWAHNTWHLYTANNVRMRTAMLMTDESAWNEGLYDASAYTPEDLSYLAVESNWLGDAGGGMRLLMSSAAAKTEFKNLLTDTYRNAQPVMVSCEEALYAAFIRADSESGSRYAVVTKSMDGTTWAEPVRVDADAILDDAPTMCVGEDGTVWLAYARTAADPCDSLLSYAQNQTVIVGSIDSGTLAFTERQTFSGNGFVHLQQLAVIDGQPVLMWADTALTDKNSVLLPASGTIRYSVYSGSAWSEAAELASVNGALTSVTVGAQNGQIAAAYISDGTLYRAAAEQTVELATDVTGNVCYGVLPSTKEAAFLWNGDGVLCSSNGDVISAEGISHEYAIVGDKVYYSMATDSSANLAVLQYENGNWSLPIQLTGDSRYLENLSVARLDGSDCVMGMHTAVTITEDSVEDAKNLVVSRVMPVSDLCIEYVDYDDSSLTAGESIPVTVSVTNVGDHTVNSIDLTLDGTPIKTETVELLPGQSMEIETEITCPSALTSYVFTVGETDESDYTPADNAYELSLGYADAAVELDYQQIGVSKALVATVTNQGIDSASGSVVFYDADNNPVAESTFENLASGDIAVVSYAVTDSFSGVNGGDVSAKVVLDQDELYTYNNEVTMYILATPTSIKSVDRIDTGICVTVYCEEGINATVWCASYNLDGQMIDVDNRDLTSGKEVILDFTVRSDADRAKVFVLNSAQVPLCDAKEFELK